MTEEPILKDDTAKPEPEKTTTLPEADKKRVMLGTIIGGLMFLGILIAIICMVSTEEVKPHPTPVPPVKRYVPYFNPFIIDNYHEKERLIEIQAFNNRTGIEKALAGSSLDMPTSIPVVKNTTENAEPIKIKAVIKQMDEHLINVKYYDTEYPRWEVPDFGTSEDPYAHVTKHIRTNMGFHVIDSENKTFEWKINEKEIDILPLITTEHCRLQYFDKYIEFEARIQTDYVYGMGERMESFHLKNDNYSLWNRHHPYDLGGDTERGLYGSHPFFLSRLKDKKDFMAVFMRNSNAMLFSMWHTMNMGTFVNYKMIGGIIDLYIFHAAEADYLIRKYHSVIGRPYLPPVWAMGFQQARAGYTLKDLETVVAEHRAAKIPIDAVWADADMTEDYKTFTVNSNKFQGLKEFVQKLHDLHEGIDMHFVAMTNPGIKEQAGYKYYDDALKKNALIMSAAVYETPYRGKTIAGTTVWLDFFRHDAALVWADGLHDLHDKALIDGVWISENEINNYYDAEPQTTTSFADRDEIPNPFHNTSEFEYLQYRPTLDPLERDTIPMWAYHCCDDMFNKQYFTHNLYGLQVSKATYEALYGIFEDKRFFVASRSTWPGSGQYSSHWLDGNYATWESMKASIAGMLNFNMFGIPHVGAPIGGFYHDATPELLARWYELGCFSPLMLSYTDSNTNRKEVYADKTIVEYIKNSLMERYSLIRFMYTKIFEAFMWGGSVIHPLFFDFQEDDETYKRDVVDRTFMWAKTLYVIPALIPGQVNTKAYLPNWRWYDLRTKDMVLEYTPGGVGEYLHFEQPLGYITVLIKGGSIIPYQYLSRDAKAMNVEDLKLIPAMLIVAPDHEGKAIGTMVVDTEGIRPHPDPASQTYRLYTFTYMNQIFRINKLAGFDFHDEREYDYFWEVLILDAKGADDYACMLKTDMRKKEIEHSKTYGTNVLKLHDEHYIKVPMYNLESIVWGSNEQHDFCKFTVYLDSLRYENDDRTAIGELVTADPLAYQLKYDLKVSALTDSIVSLQISMNDKGAAQWIVPDVIDEEVRKTFTSKKRLAESGFRMSPLNTPFAFEMSDPDDPRDFLFTTRNSEFVYVKNYIHIRFMLNSRHMFGLGERVGKFELGDGLYSLWSYDMAHEETGVAPGNNMYGSHPFYIAHMHNPNKFAGIFFLNSNAMDVKIKHVGMQTIVDHMFSGGIIDAFFIQEGTVEQLMESYHYLIGRPVPLPFWAFGYHQSRWGYRDIKHLNETVNSFIEFNIPLDAVWMDKDYMDHYRTFTIDTQNWYGIKQFVESLHAKGKHFVAIVDPAIVRDPHFELYNEGLQMGVYIRTSHTKPEPLVGVTWPGYSVWVDFLNPTANEFWQSCLTKLHSEMDFDGIWLDMNEPSNFCDGDCADEIHYTYYYFPLDYYDDLYYNPTHRGLEKGTVSMEAVHYGDPVLSTEFNYHSLYGLLQSRTTARFFMTHLNKRPFIISSSTFPGSARWAAHWLGDNYSSWHYMEYSIAGMFNFQLFGIPFVGADICGFSGNATMNLCSRWMQLGAFYPFMRNHNGPTGSPQEPYVNAKLMSVSKKAIHLRYRLARYLYSEYMHAAHRGGLIITPLLFDFPEDNNTYSILDNTFMFGRAIKVTPVLDDKVDVLHAYFPNNDWYEYPSLKQIMQKNGTNRHGQTIDLHCSLDGENINLHIKGGRIFAEQDHSDGVTSILQLHDLPITLIVAPNNTQFAIGNLYYDDEDHTSFRDQHRDYIIIMNQTTIKFHLLTGNMAYKYPKKDQYIHSVKILNAKPFEQTRCAKYVELESKNSKHLNFKYANEILELTPTDENSMSANNVDSIVWSNNGDC